MKEFVNQDKPIARIENVFVDEDVEGKITDSGMCPAQPFFLFFGRHAPGIERSLILAFLKMARKL